AYPFSDVIRDAFPEIKASFRMQPLRVMLQKDDHKYNELMLFVEPDFLKIFDVKVIQGSVDGLANPFSAVISRRAALKYFGRIDVVGETLIIGGKNPITVASVMENWPENSHLSPDILSPLDSFYRMVEENAKIDRSRITGWNSCHCYPTYFLL